MGSGNYYRYQAAQREAYRDVPETCPIIDDGLSALEAVIKTQTSKLRDALVDAHSKILRLEEEVDDLEKRNRSLENDLGDAQTELQEAERIISNLREELRELADSCAC